MHIFLGHIGGMPAEELLIGLAPVTGAVVLWMRVTGQRVRDRYDERRHH